MGLEKRRKAVEICRVEMMLVRETVNRPDFSRTSAPQADAHPPHATRRQMGNPERETAHSQHDDRSVTRIFARLHEAGPWPGLSPQHGQGSSFRAAPKTRV